MRAGEGEEELAQAPLSALPPPSLAATPEVEPPVDPDGPPPPACAADEPEALFLLLMSPMKPVLGFHCGTGAAASPSSSQPQALPLTCSMLLGLGANTLYSASSAHGKASHDIDAPPMIP